MQNFFGELGHRVSLGAKTEDMISDTGIGFGVEEKPLYQWNPGEINFREVKGFKGVFRQESNEILGIVGSKYTLVHVREALKVFDPFVEEGFLEYELAGVSTNSKDLGLKIWVLARLQANYEITKGDKVLPYLLLSNSYDGSTSLSIRSTGVRLACWNQYNFLLREARNLRLTGEMPDSMSIKHTRSARKRFVDNGKWFIESLLKANQKTIDIYAKLGNKQLELSQAKAHLFNSFNGYATNEIEGKPWEPYWNIINGWSQGNNSIPAFSSLALYDSVTRWLTHERGHNTNSRFYSSQWGSSLRESRRLFMSLASEVN